MRVEGVPNKYETKQRIQTHANNKSNNNIQRRTIQCEFEPVGPALLKQGARWPGVHYLPYGGWAFGYYVK